MRIFVAIDFPESVKQSLGYLCAGLPGIKWVEDHQFHLTLRFIGETDGSRYRDVIDTLSEISVPEFTIVLSHIGTFPFKGAPRVLWVGVEPSKPLLQLSQKINQKLQNIHIEKDPHKYFPHVTLGRFRENVKRYRLQHYLDQYGMIRSTEITVREFTLFSSVLSKKGAKHYPEVIFSLE